jgi:hypothetical protein
LHSYEGNYKNNLFFEKYSNWKNSDYSNIIYLQIIRVLRRQLISSQDLLQDSVGEPIKFIKLSIPDLLGINRPSIVIKILLSVQHVYEIRINTEYRKERILFYPSSSQSSAIMTFYFDKQSGNDLTDILAKETEDIYLGNINSTMISALKER